MTCSSLTVTNIGPTAVTSKFGMGKNRQLKKVFVEWQNVNLFDLPSRDTSKMNGPVPYSWVG